MQNTSQNRRIEWHWGDNLQIVQDFRYLHTIPEPDRELPKTTAYIRESLMILGCRVFSPTEGSVCAFFDFSREEALAFRADMDALPIPERTGLPWQSRHPGMMHACGHDGHCAILLELARRLSRQQSLPHNILLIFQPAEETTGGAEALCGAGVLEQYRVRYIFGLHLWPGLPAGRICSRSGVLMSRGTGVTVRFTGKSAHIARWRQGADALLACCRFLVRAEKRNSRSWLLKFGSVAGGTAGNILCGKAELQGSLRTLCRHEQVQKKLTALCRAAARRTGCQGQVIFQPGYPAVENPAFLFKKVKRLWPIGPVPHPCFTAEDFSRYQQRVPGVFFLLGVGDTPPLHSDSFSFDEAVLKTGADFFFHLASALRSSRSRSAWERRR